MILMDFAQSTSAFRRRISKAKSWPVGARLHQVLVSMPSHRCGDTNNAALIGITGVTPE